ncbi:MAG: secretin N-terminal domain-containing protein [Phycisphaerales bacterium]|nr:secretin N-terminal domain-containing protein [Phycisphaerales bacterium]
MSIKTVLQLILTFIIAVSASAIAQDRPVPEPAPTIDLPDPEVQEEVLVEEEVSSESNDSQEDIDTQELDIADTVDVEVVTGTSDTIRWPLQREIKGGLVILSFDDVTIEETLGFIAQTTGKVVIPVNAAALKSKKITLHNDEPVDRGIALDLLFQAFRLNDVGVIERNDIIIIGTLQDMLDDIGDIPVIGVDEDVMNRQDRGTLVIKVYSVEKTEANVIGDNISEMFPDYGSLTVYPESNQIVLLGDIGLCQQVQQLINQLDRIWRSGKLKTFRLKYADASEISSNILDLFEESGSTSTVRSNQNRNQRSRTTPTTTNTEEVELRLTVNMQQNSVTVQAEPEIMDDIEELIITEWDLPRPTETSKMYVLKYSDPIKIRNLLQEILGDGSTGGGGSSRPGQNQRADVTQSISGVYRFEAYPDKNALLVLSKTEESFSFLDAMIESLDQPSDVGLPIVVELKHANAVALSEELNALLAPPGVSATIPRPDSGLSGEGFSEEGESASGSSETGGQLSFPWQQGGTANSDDQSPESSLISKIRIVPIVRQNAITVLAPPAYLQSIIEVIEKFDRATRQVMISATIAAVTLTDDLELGLRWGSNLAATGDNSVGLNGSLAGTIDNVLSGLFEDNGAIFTLGSNTNNVGMIIDLLNQLTNVRIIQQPRTFTSDNQESVFFNGSEVPIRTTSTLLSGGETQTGIEYRDVGVMLNVRPRITTHGNIDLTINVELSEQSGASADIDNNPIFSRRQVRSQVQLKNGQTVLIGGLLKESESKVKRKVPLLGDIPLIGGLFSSVDDTTVREELLVFITPIIVEDLEDNDSNYNVKYLERLEEISMPLDEFIKKVDEGDDFLNDRLKHPSSDYRLHD